MAVTPDEYELPLFVTDSSREMAKRFGISTNALFSNISHGRTGAAKHVKFIKITIDDKE